MLEREKCKVEKKSKNEKKISRDTGIAAYSGIYIELHLEQEKTATGSNQPTSKFHFDSQESEWIQKNVKYFIDLMMKNSNKWWQSK